MTEIHVRVSLAGLVMLGVPGVLRAPSLQGSAAKPTIVLVHGAFADGTS